VLLSKYSDTVIGAGEFWLSKSGDLKVNGNSGSYLPGEKMIKAIIEVFEKVFPGIEIVYAPIEERPEYEVDPEDEGEEEIAFERAPEVGKGTNWGFGAGGFGE
jgi:hypothetical protein